MKTVLITGASRGIGRAAALAFASAGYAVAAGWHQNEAAAASLLRELMELGCDAEIFRADISDGAQVERMMSGVTDRFRHIDVLINNAGISDQRMLCDTTTDQWERMFSVNVTGMFHTCRAVLPQMVRRGAGTIINLSSIWGITGASCETAYSASKAAVLGLTKSLAKEVAPSGITVNCVAPGVIETGMLSHFSGAELDALRGETPLGVLGTPEDIAGVLTFLASPQAKFITGQVISPNGGFVI